MWNFENWIDNLLYMCIFIDLRYQRIPLIMERKEGQGRRRTIQGWAKTKSSTSVRVLRQSWLYTPETC